MDIFYLLSTYAPGTEANGFCANTVEIWQLVGVILMVARIVFPLLVIIWGIIDVGKSVTSSKPEEITKAFKSLAFRLGAALAIFFIPTIVSFGIRLVAGFQDVDEDYKICANCLVSPRDDDVCGNKKNPNGINSENSGVGSQKGR